MLSVRMVADRFAVSEETIRRMIARGELEARRFGRTIRVPRAAVEAIECREQTEGRTCGSIQTAGSGKSGTSRPVVVSFARRASEIADALRRL